MAFRAREKGGDALMLHWLTTPWVTAGFGSMIGGAFAFFLAIRFMERAALPMVREMFRERDAEMLKHLQRLAHELDTLRKTQSLESEWFALSRELAEADGKKGSG
jgi:hypothetical protein